MARRKISNEELGRPDIATFKEITKIPVVVILDNVRSLNNVGSVFRSSDAFLVQKVYLCGITGTPPNKDIRKTALGATESVSWEHREDAVALVKELQAAQYEVFAVEQVEGAISLEQVELKLGQKYAVILGNEVFGVQQELVDIADEGLEIPQFGTKHSINVSVCCGVVLWEFFRQLKYR